MLVVDELCNVIKKGCTLDEFKRAMSELLQPEINDQEEEKIMRKNTAIPAIQEFDFSLIGTQGWSVLHQACTSGNSEIVEYLLQKK